MEGRGRPPGRRGPTGPQRGRARPIRRHPGATLRWAIQGARREPHHQGGNAAREPSRDAAHRCHLSPPNAKSGSSARGDAHGVARPRCAGRSTTDQVVRSTTTKPTRSAAPQASEILQQGNRRVRTCALMARVRAMHLPDEGLTKEGAGNQTRPKPQGGNDRENDIDPPKRKHGTTRRDGRFTRQRERAAARRFMGTDLGNVRERSSRGRRQRVEPGGYPTGTPYDATGDRRSARMEHMQRAPGAAYGSAAASRRTIISRAAMTKATTTLGDDDAGSRASSRRGVQAAGRARSARASGPEPTAGRAPQAPPGPPDIHRMRGTTGEEFLSRTNLPGARARGHYARACRDDCHLVVIMVTI